MVKIPQPVMEALHTLREAGIQADIYPMYGTAYIHYVISLPNVVIKEIDETKDAE